jgi:hypothetical protein
MVPGPSGSVEVSVKVTVWPAWGLAGALVKDAVGGWLAGGEPAAPTRTQRAAEGTPWLSTRKSMW